MTKHIIISILTTLLSDTKCRCYRHDDLKACQYIAKLCIAYTRSRSCTCHGAAQKQRTVHPACTNEVLFSPSQANVESVSGVPVLASAVPARYSMNTDCLL